MLRIVAATPLTESAFWEAALLARSLERLAAQGSLAPSIVFENDRPLADVYNAALAQAGADDILLFTHDDVEIRSDDLQSQLQQGLGRFDVVGVAGNRRRLPKQGAWPFRDLRGTWDREYLSGKVSHPGEETVYGPAPAEVKLIDGLLIAARAGTLRKAEVAFDPEFAFHFYDLDFCRSCERAGLKIGTWPIDVYHASGGEFGSSDWNLAYYRYLAKWRD